MSPSCCSGVLPSETSTTADDQPTAAIAAEWHSAAADRRRRELEKTEPAPRAVGSGLSDGRCEPSRMRRSLDIHGADDVGCWPAPHRRWVETRDRPRLLSAETKTSGSKVDDSSASASAADEGKVHAVDGHESDEEEVAVSSSDDSLEAALRSEDSPKAQDLRYHSASNSVSARSPDSTATTGTGFLPLERLVNGYENSRVYVAHVFFLDWRDLPGRRSGHAAERIWILGATDREGRHRTRLLVVGREWRPRCLKNVNMINQPVVYAGGGRGSLTSDLFLWWFHHEFAPTAMAMHSSAAILVVQQADYLPNEDDCVSSDGLVKLVIVPKDYLEPKFVANELRTRLAVFLLFSALFEARMSPEKKSNGVEENVTIKGFSSSLDDYVNKFSLKEAFAELHRSWLAIRPDTFSRCWKKTTKLFGQSPQMADGNHAEEFQEEVEFAGELQQLARDAGLQIDEEDVQSWLVDKESEYARCVKKTETIAAEENGEAGSVGEEEQELRREEEEATPVPESKEVVKLLSRVLIWMEGEPLDPGFLLAVRAMRATATFMASKMGLTGTHPSGLPFFCPNGDHLTQPPPAHMGIPPYGALDAGKAAAAAGEYWPSGHQRADNSPSHPSPTWKQLLTAAATTTGLTRAPMYPFSTGQYPYPMLSPEMTQVAASWHTPSMYPISPASAGFRSPYPTSLPITSSSLPSDLYRFSPTSLMPPHPGLSPHAHALASHALVSSAPKADHSTLDHNHRSTIEQKNSTSLPVDNTKNQDTGQQNNQDKKKPHIKKPLNAFMLYMKEMRAKVVAECTLKESAAINQILGRRWHSLSREEQQRYYEAARHERQLHQQRYPGWSARDNYGYGSKKKKRKKERSADPTGGRDEQAKYYELARRERQLHMQLYPDWSSRANTNRTKKRKRKQDTNSDPGGNNMKKCRARFGLDQQSQWCKPCRRKKKCIRYMGEGGDGDGDGEAEDEHSEDNLGSVGEAGTPEDDESLSSPGGLSGLSSLASPSLVLPSPSSLASPCPLTPPVVVGPGGHQHQQQQQPATPHRNPVGTNPHDINNPLSVNQLTGQCIKTEPGPQPSNPAISVT